MCWARLFFCITSSAGGARADHLPWLKSLVAEAGEVPAEMSTKCFVIVAESLADALSCRFVEDGILVALDLFWQVEVDDTKPALQYLV